MEKIKKATFEKWVAKSNWLKINEGSSTNGRQDIYLTPSGNILVAAYSLDGNLLTIGTMRQPPQQPQSILDFPGGQGFPFKGGKG